MNYSKQAKTITYVLELIVTTCVLVATLISGKTLLFDDHPTATHDQLKVLQLCLAAMSTLYGYELIYRPQTSIPLTMHHIITILISALMIKLVMDHSQLHQSLAWGAIA